MTTAVPVGAGEESSLQLGTTLVLALLLLESPGTGAMSVASLAVAMAVPALALSLCVIARRRGFHCLHMAVGAALLGSVGMLIGVRLDFGPFGLATLAEWCTARSPAGLDSVREQLVSAPWTYGAMLVGCNVGMALSARPAGQTAATRSTLIVRCAACSAGMLLAMFLTEALLRISSADVDGVRAELRALLIMVLGMTAGMWGGWRCAECLVRGCSRAASLAVLRDASRARG